MSPRHGPRLTRAERYGDLRPATMIGTGQLGLVYVLCFDRPYLSRKNDQPMEVRHYIGWTHSAAMLRRRLSHHRTGQGARLLDAVARAGIGWTVVAIFRHADRHFERWLHQLAKTNKWCPRCASTHRHIRRYRQRLRAGREQHLTHRHGG